PLFYKVYKAEQEKLKPKYKEIMMPSLPSGLQPFCLSKTNFRSFLLLAIFMMLPVSRLLAQETEPPGAPASVSWSERDMTYRGGSYDVLDTNYVPAFRMDQHRKFLNHEYQFPAKPRNMWEIGVGFGLYNVSAD